MKELFCEVVISNDLGLPARAAAMASRIAQNATGQIWMVKDGNRVDAASVQAGEVDQSRWITVEFTGHTTSGLPWEFRPLQKKMRVHPGETAVANYYVRNNTDEPITGQAVPSVVPGRAAPYFKKIECFCFSQQTLAPREAKEMPVRFVVDAKISSRVDTITLSYAFFNTDKASAKKYGGDSMAVNHDGHHVHAHQAAPDG